MRDFGALVYRSVTNECLRKEKRDKKDDDDSERKKKKELGKIGSNNAPLMLAYCYFDLSHANYIASKDLEDLFLTLGLQLSRAQVNCWNSFDGDSRLIISVRFILSGPETAPKSDHRWHTPLQEAYRESPPDDQGRR